MSEQSNEQDTGPAELDIVGEQDFDDFLAEAEGLVVVDFFADWCGPCRVLSPVLASVAAEFPDVAFVKVDTEESQRLAKAFGVSSLPSVVFLRPRPEGGADVVFSAIGVKPRDYWVSAVHKALKPKKSLFKRLFSK